jgi:hypothetical protein
MLVSVVVLAPVYGPLTRRQAVSALWKRLDHVPLTDISDEELRVLGLSRARLSVEIYRADVGVMFLESVVARDERLRPPMVRAPRLRRVRVGSRRRRQGRRARSSSRAGPDDPSRPRLTRPAGRGAL